MTPPVAASALQAKPLVDPNCLCGLPHPCPNHGQWTGSRPGRVVDFDPVLLLKLLEDSDRERHVGFETLERSVDQPER